MRVLGSGLVLLLAMFGCVAWGSPTTVYYPVVQYTSSDADGALRLVNPGDDPLDLAVRVFFNGHLPTATVAVYHLAPRTTIAPMVKDILHDVSGIPAGATGFLLVDSPAGGTPGLLLLPSYQHDDKGDPSSSFECPVYPQPPAVAGAAFYRIDANTHATDLVLGNPSSQGLTITVRAYGASGQLLATGSVSLAGGEVRTLALDRTLIPLGGADGEGAVTLSAPADFFATCLVQEEGFTLPVGTAVTAPGDALILLEYAGNPPDKRADSVLLANLAAASSGKNVLLYHPNGSLRDQATVPFDGWEFQEIAYSDLFDNKGPNAPATWALVQADGNPWYGLELFRAWNKPHPPHRRLTALYGFPLAAGAAVWSIATSKDDRIIDVLNPGGETATFVIQGCNAGGVKIAESTVTLGPRVKSEWKLNQLLPGAWKKVSLLIVRGTVPFYAWTGGGPAFKDIPVLGIPWGETAANPAPVLQQLQPEWVMAGSGAVTLTLTGNFYLSSSQVYASGAAVATRRLDAQHLEADLPAELTVAPADIPITVTNPAPGGGSSTTLTFRVTGGVPAIAGMTPASVPAGSTGVEVRVDGGLFAADAVIRVNSMDLSTFYHPASPGVAAYLTASLPDAMTATPGILNLTVFNPGLGGGESAPASLTVTTGVPVIATLTPAEVLAGTAGILLRVDGGFLCDNSVVQANGADLATTYHSGSPAWLTTILPDALTAVPGTVAIAVANPGVGGGVSAPATLTVIPGVPEIAGLTPTETPAGSVGVEVRINGARFFHDSQVRINGSGVAATFHPGSPAWLTALLSDTMIATPGVFSLTVFNPGPGGGESEPISFTVAQGVPVIDSISPASAPAGGSGVEVRLDGSRFYPDSVVQVDGTGIPTIFHPGSPAWLTAILPDSLTAAPGVLNLTVLNPGPSGGESAPVTLTVSPAGQPPVITLLTPAQIAVGSTGAVLYVFGNAVTPGASIMIDGESVSTESGAFGVPYLMTTLPDGFANQPATHWVAYRQSDSADPVSEALPLTVVTGANVPVIQSLVPGVVPTGATGVQIHASGMGFQSGAILRLDGVEQPTIQTDEGLETELPPSLLTASGFHELTVWNPGTPGIGSAPVILRVLDGPPRIQALDPAEVLPGSDPVWVNVFACPIAPASTVLIDQVAGDASFAFMGGLPVALRVQVPASIHEELGNHPVTVVNDWMSEGESAPAYLRIVALKIDCVTPAEIPAGATGVEIRVDGGLFQSDTTIWVDDVELPTVWHSGEGNPDWLTAVLPDAVTASAGTLRISLRNPGPDGAQSSPVSLSVLSGPPVITWLDPTDVLQGSTGVWLWVEGYPIYPGTVVRVDGVDCDTAYNAYPCWPSLSARVPDDLLSSAGIHLVTVTNPGTSSGESSPAYLHVRALQISCVIPASIPAGVSGMAIQVVGSPLLPDTVIRVDGVALATTYHPPDSGWDFLTAILPDSVTAAPGIHSVTLQNSNGDSSSAVDLYVQSGSPDLQQISPAEILLGNPESTIRADASPLSANSILRVDGVDRPTTYHESGSPCTNPYLEAGLPDDIQAGPHSVTVFNPGPFGGESAPLTLQVYAPPVIGGITPASVLAGATGVELRVDGGPFYPDSEIYIQGWGLPTVYHNDSSGEYLTALIEDWWTASAREWDITVYNPAPSNAWSELAIFSVNNPAPALDSAQFLSYLDFGASVRVALHGSGFIPSPDGTLVHAGTGTYIPNFISSTELLVDALTSEAMSDVLALSVENPAPGGGVSDTIELPIPPPPPLLAVAGPAQTVIEGDPVTLDGSASTGFIRSYRWDQLSGPPALVADPTLAQVQFPAPVCPMDSQMTFALTVSDGTLESTALTSVQVVKRPASFAVTIASPADQDVLSTATAVVTGELLGSYDPARVRVLVNGTVVELQNGLFQGEVALLDGENRLRAEAFETDPSSGFQKRAAAEVTVFYQPVQPPDSTGANSALLGRVFEDGTGQPLVDVRITVQGVSGVIFTNPDGAFRFPLTIPDDDPARTVCLTVTRAGYSWAQRVPLVRSGEERWVEDVFLMPLDPAVTEITPAGGTAVNSAGTVILEVPAGAVDASIQVNLTELARGRALPGPLPFPSVFTYALFIDNDREIKLQKPARLLLANTLGFPPGMKIPVGSYEKSGRRWEDTGMCRVTDDGQHLEYFCHHFSAYDLNNSQRPGKGEDGDGGDPGGGGGGGGSCDKSSDEGNSRVGLALGDLEIRYDTVPYKALGRDYNLTLRYNSGLLLGQVPLVFQEDNSRTVRPDFVKIRCFYKGNRFETTYEGRRERLLLPILYPAVDATGSSLPTGYFHFTAEIENKYSAGAYWSAACFSCPPQVNTGVMVRDPIVNQLNVEGDFFFHNPADPAPCGRGWAVEASDQHRLFKVKGTNKIVVREGPAEKAVLYGGLLQRISNTSHMHEPHQNGNDNQCGVSFDGTQNIRDYRMEEYMKFCVHDGVIYYFLRGCQKFLKLDQDGSIQPFIDSYPFGSTFQHMATDSHGVLYLSDGFSVFCVHPNGLTEDFCRSGSTIPNDVTMAELYDGQPLAKACDYGFGFGSIMALTMDDLDNLYLLCQYRFDPSTYIYQRVALLRISSEVGGRFISVLLDGGRGDEGDGGPAISAKITPFDPAAPQFWQNGNRSVIRVDKDKNVYILCARVCPECYRCVPPLPDQNPCRAILKKIDADGIIQTIGGMGDPTTWREKVSPDRLGLNDLVFGINETIQDFDLDNEGRLYFQSSYSQERCDWVPFRGMGSRIRVVENDGMVHTLVDTFARDGYGLNQDFGFEALIQPFNSYAFSYRANLMGMAVDRSTGYVYINGENTPDDGGYDWGNLYVYKNSTFYQSLDSRYAYDDDSGVLTDSFTGETVAFDGQGRMLQQTDRNGNTTAHAYDAEGRLVGVTDPLGGVTALTYDGAGNLDAIVDPVGRTTAFQVNSSGDLVRIVSPDGAALEFGYDTAHRLTSKKMPDNSVFQYAYDPEKGHVREALSPTGELRQYRPAFSDLAVNAEDPTGESDPAWPPAADEAASSKIDGLGHESLYGFDVRGRTLWASNPRGETSFRQVDRDGRLLRTVDPAGLETIYTYNQYGFLVQEADNFRGVTRKAFFDGKTDRPAATTDALGHAKTYVYDARGNLTEMHNPDGGVWCYACDARGLQIGATNPLNHTTTYEYDARGNLWKMTDPLGHTTVTDRDAAGNVTAVTDPNGNTTTFTYDDMNRKLTRADPYGNTTTYAYVCSGTNSSSCSCCSGESAKMASVTDPLGNPTSFEYDGVGNQIKKTDPLGFIKTMEYDLNRNLISVTDEEGRVTRFEYDEANRQTVLIGPDPQVLGGSDGPRTETAYDVGGRTISRTDPLGRTTHFEYDSAGRLTAQVDALEGRTEFQYDAVGNRTAVTDANGHTTSFTYDVQNRLLTETDPLNRTHSSTYDTAGRLSSTTDAKGQTLTYTYDDANRLLSKNYPDATQETYAYDNNGNLLQAVNPAVSTRYTYDARNLQLTITNNTINKTVSYTYGETGRKNSLTYPDGETIVYTRDARGHVGHLESNQPSPGGEPVRWVNYAHNPDGSLAAMDYQFGMNVTRAYDSAGRLIDLKYTKPDTTVISDFAYTHDAAGNILSKTTDFGLVQYGYDALDRMVLAAYDWKPDETFAYDPVGNRTANAGHPVWQYDAANQLLAYGAGPHDPSGQTPPATPAFTFTYDANGSTITQADLAAGTTDQYGYNFDNRMDEVKRDGDQVATYAYDHMSQRIRKDLYAGGVLTGATWFVYGQEGLLAEYSHTGALIKKYAWQPGRPWSSDPLYQSDLMSGDMYYINDLRFIPQKMVDRDISITWFVDWEAFGNANIVVNNGQGNLRFPGQYHDIETNLLYNWHRCYQPSSGRYVQKDPLFHLNLYIYAFNNPNRFIDYSGLVEGDFRGCSCEKATEINRYIQGAVERGCRVLKNALSDHIFLARCAEKFCNPPAKIAIDCKTPCQDSSGRDTGVCACLDPGSGVIHWVDFQLVRCPESRERIMFHELSHLLCGTIDNSSQPIRSIVWWWNSYSLTDFVYPQP